MPLNNILVITFTEKAAANMKVKIFKELKNNKIEYLGQENHISTIHSFCSKVLRKHAIEAGLTQYFNVGNDEDLNKRLTRVENNVLENEADRLRSELFDCGNRCRRGIRLHPEEMDHIHTIFRKYSEVLKQNGPGKKEYEFIVDYYNNQTFPAYHTSK